MIVYNVGDMVKIREDSHSLGVKLTKGMRGVVTSAHSGQVEVAVEGLGLVTVTPDLIKRKVTKIERPVKAKNVRLTDEVFLPGTGEYNKVGNLYRNNYDTDKTTITVETVIYASKDFEYNEMVQVRR